MHDARSQLETKKKLVIVVVIVVVLYKSFRIKIKKITNFFVFCFIDKIIIIIIVIVIVISRFF